MIHFSTYSLDNKCDPPTAYIFFNQALISSWVHTSWCTLST